MMQELSVVGKSEPRIDGLEKVTGRAKFAADYKVPGCLYGKILRSSHAHAKVMAIDTSAAKKLKGVRTIVTGEDAPDVRSGQILWDAYVLCKDRIVRYVGQPIAAVAADTEEIAEEALDLINVEYEELPAIFDAEESLKKESIVIHPELPSYICPVPYFARPFDPDLPNVFLHFKIRHGDIDAGFKQADVIVENRYSAGRVAHCQLETFRATSWVECDGTLMVRTATQQPSVVAQVLSHIFSLPPSKVRVQSPYVGGGFGGRCGTALGMDAISALLAIKSKRPVHLELTRQEQFVDGRQRLPIITYIKDGVRKDGTLVARELKLVLDAGAFAEIGIAVVRNCSFGAVGSYRVPNFKLDSYGTYTNLPPTAPFRGLGSTEVEWAIEQQMDTIARKLGISPVDIRKKNILRDGDTDVCGQTAKAVGVGQCLDEVVKWIESEEKEKDDGPWKKGRGVAIGNKYTIGGTTSVVMVKVWPDETIEVRHNADEMGQGLNTVVAQITAEEFGISPSRVRVVRGDTWICPYDFGSISQRSTFHVGNAVVRACQNVKNRIFTMAAPRLQAGNNDLEMRDGTVYVKACPVKSMRISTLFDIASGLPYEGGELIGTGSYAGHVILEDPETGQSPKMVMYFGYCAHAVDVAVNTVTGEVKVLRIAGAVDAGRPINPKMIEGQIQGGFGQGIAVTLFEKCIYSDNGMLINPQFADYKIPGASEMPYRENSKAFITAVPHPDGPFGAKGVGEQVTISIPAAIGNAIYDALGIRIMDVPILREDVWRAFRNVEKECQK